MTGKLMWAVMYFNEFNVAKLYDTYEAAFDHADNDPWKPKVRRVRVTEIRNSRSKGGKTKGAR